MLFVFIIKQFPSKRCEKPRRHSGLLRQSEKVVTVFGNATSHFVLTRSFLAYEASANYEIDVSGNSKVSRNNRLSSTFLRQDNV